MISRGSARLFERASHLCASLSCIQSGALQLGPKVLDLNAEGLLKILGTQKPLHEVSVDCNLSWGFFRLPCDAPSWREKKAARALDGLK